MVASSGVVSTKVHTAEVCYNKRVVECRLAAALLGHALGCPDAVTLGDVAAHSPNGEPLAPAVVERVLHAAPYTLEEAASVLGEPVARVQARCVVRPVRGAELWLRARALHAFGEAQRVHAFAAACAAGAPLADLGRLLDASHASCRDLYACSCVELDALCAVAREAGALGARLTGAGWGGCTPSARSTMPRATPSTSRALSQPLVVVLPFFLSVVVLVLVLLEILLIRHRFDEKRKTRDRKGDGQRDKGGRDNVMLCCFTIPKLKIKSAIC